MDQTPEKAKSTKRIARLIALYISSCLSESERIQLEEWKNQSADHQRIFKDATNREQLRQGLYFMKEAQEEMNIQQKLNEVKRKGNLQFNKSARKNNQRIITMQWMAAAIFIAAIVATVVLLSKSSNHIPEDAMPGETQASLKLDDGRTIELNDTQNDSFNINGSTVIKELNGKLVYGRFAAGNIKAGAMNTLTTPRKGMYPVTLSDGTNIWLNAATSIAYPPVFTGNERRVTLLTGEAYFEVAKNPAMPFRVEIKEKNTTVEVVGTHFNISAYPDQDTAKITLLEGEIKVIKDKDEPTTLKPEEEARISVIGKTRVIKKADVLTAIAWKNGQFRLDHSDVKTVMNQIARWYDVEIVYEGAIPDIPFQGSIGRDNKLSDVIKTLEYNGIHCLIKQNKVIVKEH